MNYILPDNFDFFEELKKENNKITVEPTEETCLINGESLESSSYIELECGHKFNYLPLLNSIEEEKVNTCKKTSYYYSYNRLKEHQLRCPYCRQIQEKILPYFPDLYKKRVRGVNHPPSLSMGCHECNHVFKSGKNKGTMCGKKCYRSKCHLHYKPEVSLRDIKCERDELSKQTIVQLRKLAKHYQLKKYSSLKKKDLINLLVNNSN